MLYTTSSIERLLNIAELRELLMQLQERFPVLYKKTHERDIAGRNRFVLTPLEGGNDSLKPNITCQGLLYQGVNNTADPLKSIGFNGEAVEIASKTKRQLRNLQHL